MRKLLLCLVFVLLLGSWSFADEQVLDISVFKQGLVLNSVKVNNSALNYPLLTYKEVVYMPLSTELGKKAGFQTHWNEALKTLTITKATPQAIELKPRGYNHPDVVKVRVSNYNIVVNGKPIQTGTYPILVYNDVTYIPLSWKLVNEVMGWKSAYHSYAGLILATDGKRKIEDIVAEQNKKYYQALAAFICKKNKAYTQDSAMNMVAAVKASADKYGLDEKWIMAVWWQESNYSTNLESGGAVGAMQIMEGTGRNFGYTKEQLLDPGTNIDLGAKYLAGLKGKYNGDLFTATVAYNQGSTRVDRGGYSPKYGYDIQKKYEIIKDFVEDYMAK